MNNTASDARTVFVAAYLAAIATAIEAAREGP